MAALTWRDQVRHLLASSREDAVALALAYVEGRAIEAAQRRERQLRKRGPVLECERRADFAAVLREMVAVLEEAERETRGGRNGEG